MIRALFFVVAAACSRDNDHAVREVELRIIALTNTSGSSVPTTELARAVIALPQAPTPIAIPAGQLPLYVAKVPLFGNELRLEVDGGRLMGATWVEGKQVDRSPLSFVGDHTFLSADGASRLRFTIVNGRATLLEISFDGLSIYRRL